MKYDIKVRYELLVLNRRKTMKLSILFFSMDVGGCVMEFFFKDFKLLFAPFLRKTFLALLFLISIYAIVYANLTY